jgi:hypothetical protein
MIDVDGTRFLYMLLVALDANLKLKNCMRPNEKPDPPLGPGLGYFVPRPRFLEKLCASILSSNVSILLPFPMSLVWYEAGLRCAYVRSTPLPSLFPTPGLKLRLLALAQLSSCELACQTGSAHCNLMSSSGSLKPSGILALRSANRIFH